MLEGDRLFLQNIGVGLAVNVAVLQRQYSPTGPFRPAKLEHCRLPWAPRRLSTIGTVVL